MRNEDRINIERRENHPITRRQDRLRNIVKGILIITIICGCIGGFIYGMIYAVNHQSYTYEFCNTSQSNLNILTNGSNVITCISKREWQGTWTLTFKTKGDDGTIEKFLNDNNILCWRKH